MFFAKSLSLIVISTAVCNGLDYSVSVPLPVGPPGDPVVCPTNYTAFNYDFADVVTTPAGSFVREIAGFASITAFASLFSGYTPVAAGPYTGAVHNVFGGAARVLNTIKPFCNKDPDLCTPNQSFGGPGVGVGGAVGLVGENEFYQDNALFIQESKKLKEDDNAIGGSVLFRLNTVTDFVSLTFGILDMDSEESSFIAVNDLFAIPSVIKAIPSLGDNSFQQVIFPGVKYVGSFSVSFGGSGALSYIKGCKNDSVFPPGFPPRPVGCP
jgi:hypothetical protein